MPPIAASQPLRAAGRPRRGVLGRNYLGELGVPYTTYDVPYPVVPVW